MMPKLKPVPRVTIPGPIKVKIAGDDDQFFSCVPNAVAECRRYFMGGGVNSCLIFQDDLVYTVDISPNWNGKDLP